MIRNEFLGLKYQGIKSLYDLIKSNDLKTNIGWKCRKYQNWSDVHENKNDKESLKAFGNHLVDQHQIKLDLLGDVNAVLLNVQKWRLDKVDFNVEPSHEEAYDKLRVLLENVKEEEGQFISTYLRDKVTNLQEIQIDTQVLYYSINLKDFFESVTNLESPSVIEDGVFNDKIVYFINSIYEDHGLEIDTEKNTSDLLVEVYKDLGLSIQFKDSIDISDYEKINQPKTIISYKKMNLSELMNLSTIAGSTFIELNKNNLYVERLLSEKDPVMKDNFEIFIKSIAESYLDLSDHQEVLDIFFNYLSLKLNDKVRKN